MPNVDARNKLWKTLLTGSAMKAGWNLARNDSRNNFIEAPYYADTFSIAFEHNIRELIKRLKAGTYRAGPLTLVDVPKSTLAIRPGSLPRIEDRVVLQAVVKLMAPVADEKLPDAVYSYRVKTPPSPDALFKESETLDIPYLKSSTISKYIDPFDPWYAVWPEFDAASKAAFLKDGFNYLAVTDIAAYFENIQLPILRDVLLDLFPDEQILVNLVTSILEGWTTQTDQRRNFHRGIPQGTQISSFLGNIFLLPLDRALQTFCDQTNSRYFRYMDDVRLFTREYPDARKGLLLIDHYIRTLHLNTQSAKTEILSEHPNKEITKRLIDTRMDDIEFVIDETEKQGTNLKKRDKVAFLQRLREIAKKDPYSPYEQKIANSSKPFKALTLRVFRRWITAHRKLGSSYYVRYLVRELTRNADHRLTRTLVRINRESPQLSSLAPKLFNFIRSDLNIFPHQEAEILWSFRYLSKVPENVIAHCQKRVLDAEQYYYVRSQAAMLLSRFPASGKFLLQCLKVFENDESTDFQLGLASLLMQCWGAYEGPTLHMLVFHPSERIRKLGKVFREVRYNVAEAQARMKYIFRNSPPWVACDNMGVLYSMASSPQPEILNPLIDYLSVSVKTHTIIGLRPSLLHLHNRAVRHLDEGTETRR